MRSLVIAAVAATTIALGTGIAQAGKCKGDYCGPAVPNVCETVQLDPATWEQVRKYHWQKNGSRAWWQARSLVCGGNCVTYGKNYTARARICAPAGSRVCYIDVVTGQQHIWTIDGIED